MLVPPHRSLVQISITLITLPVVLCSPQVDLGLDQTVGDNQRATGDFYLSNIDEVDKYPAPAPILKFITDNVQQSDIQNFLQWIHPPEHPKCDNGLFAFCCNWPAPSQNIGIRRPPNVDPGEVKKRRRNCGKWNQNRPDCLIPENNFCCDCKDVNDVAYNCYNPFYRDDPHFQGKPEPKPSPLSHPIDPNWPAPREPDLDESGELYRDPQIGKNEKHDKIERRAVVTSATNKIRSTTSTTRGWGGIGGSGADRQLLKAWKRTQPQAAEGGDDSDGSGQDVEIMSAWKRAQPAAADGDDTDENGEEVEIMRAWKRAQPAVGDGDDTDGNGEDAEIMRAWKRAPPRVADDGDDPDGAGVDAEIMRAWKRAQREVSEGDDTKRAGADAQLLRAWKRTQPAVVDSDDTDGTGGEDAQQLIMRVWQRAQPEVSVGDADKTEKIGADAQLFAAWKRSQGWEEDNSKGSSAGEGKESEGEEHYDAGNPRVDDEAMCKKKYLQDLGVFS